MLGVIDFLIGVLVGYLIGSMVESLLHEYVSDAPRWLVEFWYRYPRFFRVFISSRFSHHVIHHQRTYRRNHVTQFRSIEEREQLQKQLLARGRRGRVILAGNFANRLHAEGGVVFALPLLLTAAGLSLVATPAFALGSAFSLALPPLCSYFIHPYLHLPFEEGQKRASRPMARLLRTRYVRAMYRAHFMHHRYGGTSDFNLVLGADYIRRRVRPRSEEDEAAMRDIGMPRSKPLWLARSFRSKSAVSEHISCRPGQ